MFVAIIIAAQSQSTNQILLAACTTTSSCCHLRATIATPCPYTALDNDQTPEIIYESNI